jgi:hypothetical protein
LEFSETVQSAKLVINARLLKVICMEITIFYIFIHIHHLQCLEFKQKRRFFATAIHSRAFLPIFSVVLISISGGNPHARSVTATVFENGTKLRSAIGTKAHLSIRKHAPQYLKRAGHSHSRRIGLLAEKSPRHIQLFAAVGMKCAQGESFSTVHGSGSGG